jgi:inner membrane protein
MDPISQGITGSSAALLGLRKPPLGSLLSITILGFLSGMAPDLDILIRSKHDSLLFLEYHRQFTHSLIFIPFGGFLCAACMFWFVRKQLSFLQVFITCSFAYGTHGLLDTCTSYGTQLLWPFSDARFALDIISIIDPIYTVPLLILVVLCCARKKMIFAQASMVWVILYLGFGCWQHYRAISFGKEIAALRGHEPDRISAKPSMANMALWKIVYEAKERFYVDAVHLFPTPLHYEGESIAKLNPERSFQELPISSKAQMDIARFGWFSNDYTALHPQTPRFVIDVRYSFLPNQINPLWGVIVPADPSAHVKFVTTRRMGPERRKKFWSMLMREAQ